MPVARVVELTVTTEPPPEQELAADIVKLLAAGNGLTVTNCVPGVPVVPLVNEVVNPHPVLLGSVSTAK